MNTAFVIVPGSLVLSLAGMAYAVGGRVLCDAWRIVTASHVVKAPHAIASLAQRRAMRTIAAFEAVKGVVALAAGLGLLGLLHHDVHRIVASLIGHIGLDPGAHYPALLLHDVDRLHEASAGTLMWAVCAYAVVRAAEAYGLWKERRWGEWLGALSGAVYLPFELHSLLARPAVFTAAVIAINVAVVGYLGWRLRRQSTNRR